LSRRRFGTRRRQHGPRADADLSVGGLAHAAPQGIANDGAPIGRDLSCGRGVGDNLARDLLRSFGSISASTISTSSWLTTTRSARPRPAAYGYSKTFITYCQQLPIGIDHWKGRDESPRKNYLNCSKKNKWGSPPPLGISPMYYMMREVTHLASRNGSRLSQLFQKK
jgi:hypothetical protein